MTSKRFTKEAWNKAVEGLRESYKVWVPAKDGAHHFFKELTDDITPDYSATKTRMSPKHAVFPQSERMFEYSLEQTDPEANIMKEAPKDYSPEAIVGVRPCDAYSFNLVKINFDNKEYRDPWWANRYESTTFIGMGCTEPCSTCFCSSVGSGPFDEKGLDVLVYDMGDAYVAKALNEKGEKALAAMPGGQDAEADLAAAAEMAAKVDVPSKVSGDKLRSQKVTDLYDAPFWEELASGCLNCGACTFACPTCWCFDIQDETWNREGEVRKRQGDRIRNWDSCMFPLFTLHASGHNPRGLKVQRVRQRFMHKLKYYVDKYDGGVLCVGCGRCVDACPVNIDIRQVFELMNDFSK